MPHNIEITDCYDVTSPYQYCGLEGASVEHRRLLVTRGWRRGVVASVVRRMNDVTLRRARLVLGWVTVFGRVYHHGM